MASAGVCHEPSTTFMKLYTLALQKQDSQGRNLP